MGDDLIKVAELDERIAVIRENLRQLVEQATAFSGAADEERTALRIEEQQQELDRLVDLRDALESR